MNASVKLSGCSNDKWWNNFPKNTWRSISSESYSEIKFAKLCLTCKANFRAVDSRVWFRRQHMINYKEQTTNTRFAQSLTSTLGLQCQSMFHWIWCFAVLLLIANTDLESFYSRMKILPCYTRDLKLLKTSFIAYRELPTCSVGWLLSTDFE